MLLADEPTGELDTANAKLIAEYLVKINRELGKTIIMVTHDPSVARVSTRILRIEDGIIKTALAPSEVIGARKSGLIRRPNQSPNHRNQHPTSQLDTDFRAEKIDGDEYITKRQILKHIRDSLKEECKNGSYPPINSPKKSSHFYLS